MSTRRICVHSTTEKKNNTAAPTAPPRGRAPFALRRGPERLRPTHARALVRRRFLLARAPPGQAPDCFGPTPRAHGCWGAQLLAPRPSEKLNTNVTSVGGGNIQNTPAGGVYCVREHRAPVWAARAWQSACGAIEGTEDSRSWVLAAAPGFGGGRGCHVMVQNQQTRCVKDVRCRNGKG